MARKKIIFIIVEGPSDEQALGVILNRIYGKSTVYVHIMHRDITSERGVSTSNILSKIGDEVHGYAKSNHFRKDDFKEIIHIVDMDGAFILNSNVVEDASAVKPVYSLDEIRTCRKEEIEQRNQQKSANLSKLHRSKEIWNIQYRVFYMSSNLDHVLYNKLNTSDEEKEYDSFQFVKKYKDKMQDFLSFISESSFSVRMDYANSWDYIKKENNSLQRHTNLGLCFSEDQSLT